MQEKENKTYSRRDFLAKTGRIAALGGIVAATGGVTKYTYDRYFEPIYENTIDWNMAHLSNEEFMHSAPDIDNLRMGCSFSPEKFGLSPDNDGSGDGRKVIALNTLKYAIEDLGMTNIRFGLWWEHTVDQSGNINLDFMKPYLDLLANYVSDSQNKSSEKQIKPVVQVGYKAIGWPEQHAPEFVRNLPFFPEPGATITEGDLMGSLCLDYIQRLGVDLKKEYGGQLFKYFQVENEPFQQFGDFKHEFNYDYIIKGMDIIFDEFPSASFAVNSSPEKIREISHEFIPYVYKKRPHFKGIMEYGLNLYESKPSFDEPLIGKSVGQHLRTKLNLGPEVFKENIKRSETLPYEVYVSEQQFERWGNVISPEQSEIQHKFQTLKAMRSLPLDKKISYSNLYGIEQFAGKRLTGNFTSKHLLMEDLIKRVNKYA